MSYDIISLLNNIIKGILILTQLPANFNFKYLFANAQNGLLDYGIF